MMSPCSLSVFVDKQKGAQEQNIVEGKLCICTAMLGLSGR
jgi:hypothetical protein